MAIFNLATTLKRFLELRLKNNSIIITPTAANGDQKGLFIGDVVLIPPGAKKIWLTPSAGFSWFESGGTNLRARILFELYYLNENGTYEKVTTFNVNVTSQNDSGINGGSCLSREILPPDNVSFPYIVLTYANGAGGGSLPGVINSPINVLAVY